MGMAFQCRSFQLVAGQNEKFVLPSVVGNVLCERNKTRNMYGGEISTVSGKTNKIQRDQEIPDPYHHRLCERDKTIKRYGEGCWVSEEKAIQ